MMTSTTNNVFLDSSIVVEYSKNTQTELLDYLLGSNYHKLFVSETVLSEFTFYWLAGRGNKAPYTLKTRGDIPSIIESDSPLKFLNQFTLLPAQDETVGLFIDLMQRYNLLPNDALIIATTKLHGIPAIASHDDDFIPACEGENIQLIRNLSDLT